MEPNELSAAAAAAAIREGRLTSEALIRGCLARIEARETAVGAWAHLAPEHAIGQARRADRRQAEGNSLGPLHGVPVGVKDIFDTADYPTERGSPIFAAHRPREDSAVVARLRAAGAVILGKTVTTEFAGFQPGKTRNPHDLARTPGGSSSGSAAAVADRMVPLAIGSQTAGSVIRPGSFCGVVAFKPQFGAISRRGCVYLARSLDHVGLYARSVEDIALLAESLYGADPGDADSGSVTGEGLLSATRETRRGAPRYVFAPSPFWERADADLRAAFETFVGAMDAVPRIDLPEPFARGPDWTGQIGSAETALEFDPLYRNERARLSDAFKVEVERGNAMSALTYLRARRGQRELRALLDEVLRDFDALITPAALGVAPLGIGATGDPLFCSTWTLCGHPAISLPLLEGEQGLPIGVQLIGRRGGDAELLRIAAGLYPG